jgi:hypothetical protein
MRKMKDRMLDGVPEHPEILVLDGWIREDKEMRDDMLKSPLKKKRKITLYQKEARIGEAISDVQDSDIMLFQRGGREKRRSNDT